MIRLPLEQFSYKGHPRPDVVVEEHDDAREVRLIIELEPGELAGFHRPASELEEAEAWCRDLVAAAEATRDRQGLGTSHLGHVLNELDALRRDLDQVRSARDVDRSLMPYEARALAAMLVHFADEVERPR